MKIIEIGLSPLERMLNEPPRPYAPGSPVKPARRVGKRGKKKLAPFAFNDEPSGRPRSP